MQLRDYQEEAVNGLRTSIGSGKKKPILLSPTGSGKTIMATSIAKSAIQKGKRVLFLAPRRELIYQCSRAFTKNHIIHGIIMAGVRMSPSDRVQVASFDTLHARAIRNEIIDLPEADVIIVDEAHLSIADTKQAIIRRYPDAIVIGLTATPARSDGRGLGEIYDDIVHASTVRELTLAGYLVPVRYYGGTQADLDGIKKNKDGDYQEKELGGRCDNPKLVGDIVDNWLRLAGDKSTVVFCVNRAHSRHVRDEFLRNGIKAEHLDGETPLEERKQILERVESGETQVLCNVFVATFGLDIPRLECAVLARPTKNISLYLQTAGRILRPFEGKEEAIIIDHAGAVHEHGFVDDDFAWSLDSAETVQERTIRERREKGEPKDITCGSCGTIFAGQRECPSCGHEMIPKSQEIPIYEADLIEIVTGNKANRSYSYDQKADFYGQLRGYAKAKGYKEGWAAHKYREKFGVWANDKRVKNAPATPPKEEVINFIRHLQIKNAKGGS